MSKGPMMTMLSSSSLCVLLSSVRHDSYDVGFYAPAWLLSRSKVCDYQHVHHSISERAGPYQWGDKFGSISEARQPNVVHSGNARMHAVVSRCVFA